MGANLHNLWAIKVIRYIPVLFVLGVLVAIIFYPGGNIHNAEQIGYSFTHNFLSDLGGIRSHSGATNTISAFFFNFSMVIFGFGGIAFLFIPSLFKDDAVNYKLAIIGSAFLLFGALFFAGVGFTPHDLFRKEHVFFALNGFRLMVPAAILYFIVLVRSPVDNRYSWITMFFLLSTFAYVMYQLFGGNALLDPQEMVRQATIQKMISMVHIVSIFSLSFGFHQQLELNNSK